MKGPRFSIALLMLIVALAAVLASWRVAANRLVEEERAGRAINLEIDLKDAEHRLANYEYTLAHPEYAGDDNRRRRLAYYVNQYKKAVGDLRQKIKDAKEQ